jgi:hypothetical protein
MIRLPILLPDAADRPGIVFALGNWQPGDVMIEHGGIGHESRVLESHIYGICRQEFT